MKKGMLLLAATLVLTACAKTAPEDTSAADQDKLRNDAGVWFDHHNSGNVDGITNLYAQDAVVMGPGAASASGRDAIRTYLANDIQQAKAAGVKLNSGEVTGVGASGDLAWLSGNFTVTDSAGNTVDTGKYLSVYQRINGTWLLIRDTWNSDAAPAAALAPTSTTN